MGLSLKGEEFLNKLAALYEEYGVESYMEDDTERNVFILSCGKQEMQYEEIIFTHSSITVEASDIRQHIESATTISNGLPTSG